MKVEFGWWTITYKVETYKMSIYVNTFTLQIWELIEHIYNQTWEQLLLDPTGSA